jgi:hypothetical protein
MVVALFGAQQASSEALAFHVSGEDVVQILFSDVQLL